MNFESPTSLVQKLVTNKKFRDAFVFEQIKTGIPYQLRAIRKERDWKQGDMGKAVGKPRNVINRLENPNYGKLTLKTLFELASGCEVALLVKFVPFSRLLKEYEDVSLDALTARGVKDRDEIRKLESWARRKVIAEETDRREPLANAASFTQMPLLAGLQSELISSQSVASHDRAVGAGLSDSTSDRDVRPSRRLNNVIPFRRRRNARGRNRRKTGTVAA